MTGNVPKITVHLVTASMENAKVLLAIELLNDYLIGYYSIFDC